MKNYPRETGPGPQGVPPGQTIHPESFFGGPGARQGPLQAENGEDLQEPFPSGPPFLDGDELLSYGGPTGAALRRYAESRCAPGRDGCASGFP